MSKRPANLISSSTEDCVHGDDVCHKKARSSAPSEAKELPLRDEEKKSAPTSSGSMERKRIQKSRMKQPSLIKQLQGILSEYPDGGQILKEIIQNAEDAGASEVKFLFDERRINVDIVVDSEGDTSTYTKFFKGPALVVYNNANFTEKDWERIQMINSGGKKDDPMKVGRFGLGFKSVFHITDYPCIISGDKVLLVDPHQPVDDVNAMLLLAALDEYTDEGLDPEAFWKAFDNTFDFCRDELDGKSFTGTLFWFPLREKASKLSDTLYSESKVNDLFDALKAEASSILIFLKNVEKMSLHKRDVNGKMETLLRVEIQANDGEIRTKRDEFKERIAKSNLDDEDISCSIKAVIHTTSATNTTSQEWIIVNYFVRNSASKGLRDLICNATLGFYPYVGVAAHTSKQAADLEGHVFCFLPLPKEGESLTGLPVHVNGFFALSQNRHHMKWETDEQEGKRIDDKSILWNKAMIEEALPKAYKVLIEESIATARKNANGKILVSNVYRMMPLIDRSTKTTHKRWTLLVNKVYEYLETSNILFTPYTQEWITIQKACFATMVGREESEIKAVVQCLNQLSFKYVDVPDLLFKTIQSFFPNIRNLTPLVLTSYLHSNEGYKKLSSNDKQQVLKYILSDENNDCNAKDLQLLPLASGRFEVFTHRGSNVIYKCSSEVTQILPGLENKLTADSSRLEPMVEKQLQRMCESEIYQIRALDDDCLNHLLKETMELYFEPGAHIHINTKTVLTIDWLQCVWAILLKKKVVGKSIDLPLLPILIDGKWPKPKAVKLVKLTEPLVFKSFSSHNLSDGFCLCLNAMSVNIVQDLPDWITKECIREYVTLPTPDKIMLLLGKIFDNSDNVAVSSFNETSKMNSVMVDSFLDTIEELAYINESAKQLIRKLNIFKLVNSLDDNGAYSSVYKTENIVIDNIDFPINVQFPFKCLRAKQSIQMLLKQLGAKIIPVETLVLETVRYLKNTNNEEQVVSVGDHVIKRPELTANNINICRCTSQLRFLKVGDKWHKPSDLYNPICESLQHLLHGESLFPEGTFTEEDILVLKRLGLKGEKDIDASVLLQVAQSLHKWSSDKQCSPELLKKATAFMDILIQQPFQLDRTCYNEATLCNSIMYLKCIPVYSKTPVDYPNGLPWFSSSTILCEPGKAKLLEFSLLAGATVYMVECESDQLVNKFKWNNVPRVDLVLEQLSLIRTYYNKSYKPDYNRAIFKIYEFMSTHISAISNMHVINLRQEEVIWTDSSFQMPERVIIYQESRDVDTFPYFFQLPEELRNMENLFMHLGCHRKQTSHVLLLVLRRIQTKYKDSTNVSSDDVLRDEELVVNVLKELKLRKCENSLDIEESDLLILCESLSANNLNLQPIANCIFADDEDELDPEEEETYSVVSSKVPVLVAKELGVKSLNRKTILGATEDLCFQEWGQTESLTTRIGSLLKDSYKDGLSVPKELVQNADDAGATIVKFLYDERYNDDARRKEKMLSSALEECQGPALWVYNDSLFSNDDLSNITKLNGATKEICQDKIGRFGLGFCSVYNLTDVPSFLSGSNMVIFDPHETYLEEVRQTRGAGLKIDISKQSLIRRHIDQFKPFTGVFGCNLTNQRVFNGTLFRLPLRTEHQAKKSELRDKAYTHDEVTALLSQLIENAGNVVLFTQNVSIIEIYHLPKNDNDPSQAKLAFRVQKQSTKLSNGDKGTSIQSVLARIPAVMRAGNEFAEIHQLEIKEEVLSNQYSKLEDRKTPTPYVIESTWIVSWALGTKLSLQLSKSLAEPGTVPLSSVAVQIKGDNGLSPVLTEDSPNGFYKRGHLFCFLPLPISTDLQFHINGSFSVTSDRRGLVFCTDDDIRRSDKIMWNQALMEDSVVCGFIRLLLFLSQRCSADYEYSALWPLKGTNDITYFKNSFYKSLLIDKPKLFKGAVQWLSADEVVFLDPGIRAHKTIGDTAFQFLSRVPVRPGKVIIELSPDILTAIKKCKVNSDFKFTDAMISEEELMLHFLSNINDSFWNSIIDKRNEFVLHALASKKKQINARLCEIPCIPVEPHGTLQHPNELICPTSDIAEMFEISDGRFPLKSAGFCTTPVIDTLIDLGMNNEFLPNDMLIERCCTVKEMLGICDLCALGKCVTLVKYSGKMKYANKLTANIETLSALRVHLLLPVLQRPKTWQFPWKAESDENITRNCQKHGNNQERSTKLKRPDDLHIESSHVCSGSVCFYIDETYLKQKCHLPEGLLFELGVKSEMSSELLSQQLALLSTHYTDPERQFNCLEVIHRSILDSLVRASTDHSDEAIRDLPVFQSLMENKTILIGRELVKPSQVAINVKEDCPPELYRLPDVVYKRKKIYKAFGVEEHFSVTYLLSVLKRLHTKWFLQKCEELEIIRVILTTLSDSMKKEKIDYDSLDDNANDIIAPDANGILMPTYDLVIEDPAYQSSTKLHILHGSISPNIGKALGVKSKQRKIVECFSEGFFMPFGQNESLVTRLNGILEDYPCDSSIMKELIQNADDAGATEICFIKDYLTHSSDKMFGRKEMQGPSLCIFNDSYFTELDFEGIRKLGIGSKRDDSSKTGQYGIGFNAVYHLTDVPSFLTRGPNLGKEGQMCIFDPLISYLEGYATEENPGMKCNAELVRESFPDMLEGYPIIEKMRDSGQGTVFRLPLRTEKSHISSNVVSIHNLDELINEFKQSMFESLLFLKNIRCIKVLKKTKKRFVEEFVVQTKMTREDFLSRNVFYNKVKDTVKRNDADRIRNLSMKPIECTYTLEIADNEGRQEHWLVQNSFGYENTEQMNEIILNAVKERNIGLLPIASIALPLSEYLRKVNTVDTQRKVKPTLAMKAYCFLPLPITTGLPFHVNGHFALDKARTKLWNEGHRRLWNEFVINELLSRVWVSAIQTIKDQTVQKLLTESPGIHKSVLEAYHDLFPLFDEATDMFWKSLVSNCYIVTLKEDKEIFPTIQFLANDDRQYIQNGDILLGWTRLSNSEDDFSGMFKPSTCNAFDVKKSKMLEMILKALNMKIIETPCIIKHSIEQSGINFVPTCSPNVVIKFLKTFDSLDARSCKLGGIDIPISDTKIKDPISLKCILKYVRDDKDFTDNVEGVPLCLTNDEILHVFGKKAHVYNSEMCQVLTGSAELFIHRDINSLLEINDLFGKGLMKRFTVNDLVSVFKNTFNPDILGNESDVLWDKTLGSPLKQETLIEILKFIYNQSRKTFSENPNLDFNFIFKANMLKLKSWSLFPSCFTSKYETAFCLVPISRVNRMFHATCHPVAKTIQKLNIPKLDWSIIPESRKLMSALQSMIPSTDRPVDLFDCLFYHKDRIPTGLLTCEESIMLLSYLNDNIDLLLKSKKCVSTLKHQLQCFPLYVSIQKTIVSIETFKDVVVLSNEVTIPALDVLTGNLFLKNCDRLDRLFEFLELPKMQAIDIYLDKILPQIHNLSGEIMERHIIFIRDRLLVRYHYKQVNEKQRLLIDKLKPIKFIQVNGASKKADDFYDHNHHVFHCMLSQDNFLPAKYREQTWKCFLKDLGLINEPTEDMMLEFCRQLEARVNNRISDQTRTQSSILLKHLLTRINEWSLKMLEQVRNIRFVVPYKVRTEMTRVAVQPNNADILVCISGATSSKNEDYCWSTVNLIYHEQCPEHDALGILKFPPAEKFVQHCQNVCDVLKSQLNKDQVCPLFVKKLMEKLYRTLFETFRPEMKQNFLVTPIIFHQVEKKMLSLKEIVINLTEAEEVRPFLYRLPHDFGPFAKLFIDLGSHENPLCVDYATVLDTIKQNFDDNAIPANMLMCAVKSIENLVRLIQKDKKSLENVDFLYIPDRGKVLRSSRTLTVSNNVDIEERLKGKKEIEFFVGFKELGIEDINDPAIPFQFFPPKLKPDILSEVVTEGISTEHITTRDCVHAHRLESQIKSPLFIEGILRLVKHQMRHEVVCFDDFEKKCLSTLQNISVKRVTGLKTFLSYKGEKVNGTERDATCFIRTPSQNDERFELYFQFENGNSPLDFLLEDPLGLVKFIDKCIDSKFDKESIQHIPTLFRLGNSNAIKQKLDQLRIDAYDIPMDEMTRSIFPSPGTYVEEKFKPFLQHSLSPFQEHEYLFVAYEIEYAEDITDSVFIYAHILKENRRNNSDSIFDLKYQLDIGRDEPIEVDIYCLYRFKPKDTVTDKSIVPFNTEPIISFPIDANFHHVRNMLIDAWKLPDAERRRVVRRLLLRWHPDRNSERQEYAKRVYNYINEVIISLENGEEVNDRTTNETGRMPPDMSRSLFGSSSRIIFKTGKIYARAFGCNIQDYNRSTRSGNYTHFRAAQAAVPHVGEAKRWHRQAVNDYKAASSNFALAEQDNSFNWVCYKCHQASEKALKAAWFSKDANRANRFGHSLAAIASGLDEGHLQTEATALEHILGEYSSMRYPDAMTGERQIPSEIFDKVKAEQALEITKRVLDMTCEFIG